MRSTPNGIARRPGTGVRILLFLLVVAGGLTLLSLGFPPGAPDRLPVLIAALLLALISAGRGDKGLVVFSFLFPCAGLLVRIFGGSDPVAWPVLLFAGLAAGWTFRFIYDFESSSEPSAVDGPLGSLAAVWVLGAVLALVRARTLWAIGHRLAGRAVNVAGLGDAVAIRESAFALSVVGGGAAFFFLLRRAGELSRRRAANAVLCGIGVSAAAAILEAVGFLPPESSPFWRMSGRLSGGAADPNSLGLLCGLGLVYAVVAFGREPGRRGLLGFLLVLFVAGLFLSGSRSALLLVLFAAGSLLFSRGVPPRLRVAFAGGVAIAVLAAALFLSRAGPGTLGRRMAQTFDPSTPVGQRVSARPVLWSCAWRLFEASPVSGVGLGAFSWRLPDALAEVHERLPARDNPGSAYVQALAETGLVGLLLTFWLAWRLGRDAAARVKDLDANPAAAAAGAGVVAFLVALAFGSHWFAPDVSLLFFLFAALASRPAAAPESGPGLALRRAAVGVYAATAFLAALATAKPGETFRYSPRIGFHDVEQGQGGPFRWTRKRFALSLAPGEVRRVTLAQFTPQREPVVIEASADGAVVYRRALSAGDAVVLRLAATPDQPRVVLFRLSSSFFPKRLGFSNDRRELGLVAPE